MNTVTKNLENDHVHILKLTDVMECITKKEVPDLKHLEMVVDLIRGYADGFHHTKEETIFFPQLLNKGFSSEQGPIAVMLHEHNVGRNFVKGMAENITLYKEGNQAVITKIFENMTGYIELLRNHISKENNILFKMADNVLTEQDHKSLLNQFERVENSKVCGGIFKDCILKIENLATFYNI